MQTSNKQLVSEIMDAMSSQNLEYVMEIAHPDLQMTMIGSGAWQGKHQVGEALKGMFASTPKNYEPDIKVTRMIEEGDIVLVEGQFNASSSGASRYCDLFQFDSGKLIGLTSYMVQNSAEMEAKMAEQSAENQQ